MSVTHLHKPDGRLTWESVPCPLCMSSSEDELLVLSAADKPTDYRLVRCRDCEMVYLNPRPDEASIVHLYPENYEPYQPPASRRGGQWQRLSRRLHSLVSSHYDGYPPALERWHERTLARLARPWFRPNRHSLTDLPYHGRGRLLDFGCGSGWYAQRMRERGWHVTGMDFTESAARRVEERFGFRTLAGTLPHTDVPANSFDLITMGAVLEHVHDPHRIIAGAAKALAPGGRLLISVPNLAGWSFSAFGPDWWGLDLPRHLLHFTPATLRRLVEGHGLTVRELGTTVRAGWMRRSVAAAHRRGGSLRRRLLTGLGRVRLVSSLTSHWTGWTGQADTIRLIAERPATLRRAVDTSMPLGRAA